MAYTIVGSEYLEIDGVPLSTTAWVVTNDWVLWEPAPLRGDDVVIPGAAGALAQPRRRDADKRSLELSIVGHLNWNNVRQWDVRIGLWGNIDHLRTNLTAVPATADSTRTATLHLPTGATKTASVHVLELRFAGKGPDLAVGQLTLSLPAGQFA